jgi:hypothetical protein
MLQSASVLQALIWSRKSTGLPIEIRTAHSTADGMSDTNLSYCKLDIDIYKVVWRLCLNSRVCFMYTIYMSAALKARKLPCFHNSFRVSARLLSAYRLYVNVKLYHYHTKHA